jgi:ribosomal protein L16/L10AE
MREALAERRSFRNAVGLGLVLLLDNRLGRRVLEATRIVWKRVLKREVSLTAEP